MYALISVADNSFQLMSLTNIMEFITYEMFNQLIMMMIIVKIKNKKLIIIMGNNNNDDDNSNINANT